MSNPDPMLVALLEATVNAGASDLHLTAGRPATARRDGVLVPFEGVETLTGADTERMVLSLLDPPQKPETHEPHPWDFPFGLGPRGLPAQLLEPSPNHLELTGRGISMETATALGALPAIVATHLQHIRGLA